MPVYVWKGRTLAGEAQSEHADVADLLRRLGELGIGFRDLQTSQRSLEDIFVSLVSEGQP